MFVIAVVVNIQEVSVVFVGGGKATVSGKW
jgi:hypothetical protein